MNQQRGQQQVKFFFVKSHFKKESPICTQLGLVGQDINNYIDLLKSALQKLDMRIINPIYKSVGAFNNKCSVTQQQIDYPMNLHGTLKEMIIKVVKENKLYTVTSPDVNSIIEIENSSNNNYDNIEEQPIQNYNNNNLYQNNLQIAPQNNNYQNIYQNNGINNNNIKNNYNQGGQYYQNNSNSNNNNINYNNNNNFIPAIQSRPQQQIPKQQIEKPKNEETCTPTINNIGLQQPQQNLNNFNNNQASAKQKQQVLELQIEEKDKKIKELELENERLNEKDKYRAEESKKLREDNIVLQQKLQQKNNDVKKVEEKFQKEIKILAEEISKLKISNENAVNQRVNQQSSRQQSKN